MAPCAMKTRPIAKLVVAGISAFFLSFSAVRATERPLEGWSNLKFGMSLSEAKKLYPKAKNFSGGEYPWTERFGFKTEIADMPFWVLVMFKSGRLSKMSMSLQKNETALYKSQCFSNFDDIFSAIAGKYGAPASKPTTDYDGSTFTREVLFIYSQGASIRVISEFTPALSPPNCYNWVTYNGPRSGKQGF